MDTKGMTSDDLMQYMEGHNLRNFDIDPGEIDVFLGLNQELRQEAKVEHDFISSSAEYRPNRGTGVKISNMYALNII